MFGDEFPFAFSHGSVAFVLPEDCFVGGALFALEYGQEALSFEWCDFGAIKFGGVLGPGDVAAGCHNVDNVARPVG